MKNKIEATKNFMFFNKKGLSIYRLITIISLIIIGLSLLFQYIIILMISKNFKTIYEYEVESKIISQMEGFRGRTVRLLQAKNFATLSDLAKDILFLEDYYTNVIFYDENGNYLIHNIKNLDGDNVSSYLGFNTKQNLKNKMLNFKNKSLKNSYKINLIRYLDFIIKIELKNDYNSSIQGIKIGYMRVIASMYDVDRNLNNILFSGFIVIIFSSAMLSFIFILIIGKIIISPVNRAIKLIDIILLNPDIIPNLEFSYWDAVQMRQLITSIHLGMTEIILRQKFNKFMQENHNIIEKSNKNDVLDKIHELWIKTKLIHSCQLFLGVYLNDSQKYIIEASSSLKINKIIKKNKANNSNILNSMTNPKEMVSYEILNKFMDNNSNVIWIDELFLAKHKYTADYGADVLLIAIIPLKNSILSEDRLEEFSEIWLNETIKMIKENTLQEQSKKIDLIKEIKRDFSFNLNYNLNNSTLEQYYAIEHKYSIQLQPDFSLNFHIPNKNISFIVIGSIISNDKKAGIIAYSLLSALSDRILIIGNMEIEEMIKTVVDCIYSHLKNYVKNYSQCKCIILHFDHSTGKGTFCSYGHKYPFLITPHERKPLLITQNTPCLAISSNENYSFYLSTFQIYSGQLILICNDNILDFINLHGNKLEKALLSGILAESTDKYFSEELKILLKKYQEVFNSFYKNKIIEKDIVMVILTRTDKISQV